MTDSDSESILYATLSCGQGFNPKNEMDFSSFTQSNNGSIVSSPGAPGRDSVSDLKAKEVILVTLAMLLLITSLCLFYKNWKKNYRDINQLPYYSYMYKCESPPPPVPRVVATRAPVMHWAKAAAAIGTGLALSNPAPKHTDGLGLLQYKNVDVRVLFEY